MKSVDGPCLLKTFLPTAEPLKNLTECSRFAPLLPTCVAMGRSMLFGLASCGIHALMLQGKDLKTVVGMGPPSFLSLSVYTKADKCLWAALTDREKLLRES